MKLLEIILVPLLAATVRASGGSNGEIIDMASLDHKGVWVDTVPELPGVQSDTYHVYNLDYRRMPQISNGRVGMTAFNDTMYYSGYYSTYKAVKRSGEAHRVGIPALHVFRVLTTDEPSTSTVIPMTRTMHLNFTTGTFEEHIVTPQYFIRQVQFASAHYPSTIFNFIDVAKRDSSNQINRANIYIHVPLHNDTRWSSAGFKFAEDELDCKKPDVVAKSELSNEPEQTIALIYKMECTIQSRVGDTPNKIWIVTRRPPMGQLAMYMESGNDVSPTVMFFTTIGPDLNEVLKEVNGFIAQKELTKQQADKWEERWTKNGDIEIEGNDREIIRTTQAALYNIYSQFPFDDTFGDSGNSNDDSNDFDGLTSSGLGAGNRRADGLGHTTGETELWTVPPLIMLAPEMARQHLQFRAGNPPSASGSLMFPASVVGAKQTRSETYCTQCDSQFHWTAGAVAWAARQYISTTDETDFVELNTLVNNIGKNMAMKISRNTTALKPADATIDPTNFADAHMGPDEMHYNTPSNMFTTMLAALSVHYATYLRCRIEDNSEANTWNTNLNNARALKLTYDSGTDMNMNFDGAKVIPGFKASRADAVLCDYPLNWNMSGRPDPVDPSIAKTDAEKHEQQLISTHMSATDRVAFLMTSYDAGQTSKANQHMELLKEHIVTPFYFFRNSTQDDGSSTRDYHGRYQAINDLRGAGAFLQVLLNGYGGMRVRPERLDFIRWGMPSTSITKLSFNRLNYLGHEFNYVLRGSDTAELTLIHKIYDAPELLLYNMQTGTREPFIGMMTITGRDTKFALVRSARTNCPITDQNINEYNPYYQASVANLSVSIVLMLSYFLF